MSGTFVVLALASVIFFSFGFLLLAIYMSRQMSAENRRAQEQERNPTIPPTPTSERG